MLWYKCNDPKKRTVDWMNDLVVQAVGFVGMAFFIISYQIRSNRALFLCQLMGCIVFLI